MSSQKSNWVKIRDFKFELILWTSIHCAIFYLLCIVPFIGNQFKEIFMGMNVELPLATIMVLSYSDFVASWGLMYVLSAFMAIVIVWLTGIRILVNIADNYPDRESDKYIKLQAKLFLSLMSAFILVALILALAKGAMFFPMLKLVNAAG